MFALEFPPINEIIRWRDLFTSFNKVAIIGCLAALIGIAIFLLAGRKDPMKAPTGVRNLAETGVEFIEDQIVMQTMGESGLGWTPFLLTLFVFIYLCNLPGIIPILQMPATARMAIPVFLALLVWVIYNVVGFKHNGIKYITAMAWPAGVPVGMRPLVGVIELLSNIVLRPFSLAVAGHLCAADERPAVRRDEAGVAQADGDPAILHAGLPDRVRGARGLPSGLHLHHPHCRVHRRSSSPRALISLPKSP
jgi:F-type H+-transporting ATPase subunit a